MCAVRRRNTIVDEIADELRAMILGGQLKPGEFLEPQKVLADQFGVGLSTVRVNPGFGGGRSGQFTPR